MITKKEFKDLTIEQQVDLVNQELKDAKGTKNFGKFNLDFSYGFARSILTSNGYETLDDLVLDGVKIKLFREMNEEELIAKKEKESQKQEINQNIIESNISFNKNDLSIVIASDIYNQNLDINKDKKTINKSLPIFEDTYEEFKNLIDSNEFKIYEKKYIIELMFRTFLKKYKKDDK